MMLTDILLAEIENILPRVVEMRRYLHKNPELSGEEIETSAYVCGVLSRAGIEYSVLPEGSGIVAEVGKGESAIAIRAELDALPATEQTGLDYASKKPGVMHACGHDVHLAVGLGLLLLLKPHEDELPCRVRLLCQPAEETVGGADKMIRCGCLEAPRVERVYGFHVTPGLPVGRVAYLPGVMNAAVTDFELTVLGKSCHGAHPEQGVDAIVAASAIVSALQTVASRNFAPTTPVVVTVGTIKGGTAGNIVAGEVCLSGTLRALDETVMKQLTEQVRRVCEQTALGFGAEAQLTYTTCYPPLNSDPTLTEGTFARVRRLLGEDKVERMDAPSLGADDFAFFCQKAPACYFNVGCRGDGQGDEQVLHSALFAPDEGCMRVALEILCLIAGEDK